MSVDESAARHLVGVRLPGDWTVKEEVPRHIDATGGHFSVGYLVEHDDGRIAFLKALDFTSALEEPDFTDLLALLFEEYNFERDLCVKCRSARLDRVALAIWEGTVTVAGFGALSRVPFLVFEFADGDARTHLATKGLDAIWRLRTLHNAAVGLRQLHARGIAHQDLKPSNLLMFERAGCKVADLGRAADRSVASPHDGLPVAGDRGYAPLEHLYGFVPTDWSIRRIGCDMYHLGSLLVFFFAGTSVTGAVLAKMTPSHHPGDWKGSYAEVFPYVRQAYEAFIEEFRAEIRRGPASLESELPTIVRELCDPDPSLRGSPHVRGNVAAQYSLERYVSWFDRLARRAEVGLP